MKFTAQQKREMKTNPKAFAEKCKNLKEVLDELDHRYHELHQPVVSDEVYDIMADAYYGNKKRPVGSARTKAKSKLPVPMGTLMKFRVLPRSTQQRFLKARSKFVVMDKEDGISLQIVYASGIPVAAYTRGDFTTGLNVSHIIPALNIPKRIQPLAATSIRGELSCDKATFAKFFKDFATSRNMVGGLLNRKALSNKFKHIKFIAYEIMESGMPLQSQLQALKKYKFDVVPYKVFDTLDEETLTALHDSRRAKAHRDIDGLVVAQNIVYKNSDSPSHALAFKINSRESAVLVNVESVVWEESRLGRLIPRIKIKQTDIGGVKVQYFTGHNYQYIKDNKIGKGTEFYAVRSGDVIPYIMEVVKPTKADLPDVPFKVEGVHAVTKSRGPKSDLRAIKEITHFFSVLDAEGVKQGVVTQLVEAGYTTIRDFYKIKESDLLQLERFGERSAKQFVAALKDSKEKLTFVNAATGSGAFGEGIGPKRLQAIIDAIPNLMDREWTHVELVEAIQQVKGFKKLAEVVASNLEEFQKFCKRNKLKLINPETPAGTKMQGQSILFTSVRDKELAKYITDQGGKLASTVKNATALITKAGATNAKIEAAKAAQLPIYTPDEFIKKYRIS